MLKATARTVYFVFGWIFLLLGVIGVFLPLLPTTPFLLLTAFCFARSSERWHQWLLRQRHLGPFILDWQRHGVIRTRAKIMATLLIAASVAGVFLNERISSLGKISVAVICGSVLVFLWSRPSSPS
ncbi:YbaN family protein [Bdellovibrio sp. 22V]|uniref:YbaN family protein n=1 Tax=Bdellovibrio sp. 22V TaxID=3044166 RepID=UPI00254280AD|nr:YbaN family protein [Bdellovibrio sp. 22V]WII73623.1 YbaN family protein [Bdellovibrio sp. 22V]